MADKVFVRAVAVADRIIENDYVLVADGAAQRVGEAPSLGHLPADCRLPPSAPPEILASGPAPAGH